MLLWLVKEDIQWVRGRLGLPTTQRDSDLGYRSITLSNLERQAVEVRVEVSGLDHAHVEGIPGRISVPDLAALGEFALAGDDPDPGITFVDPVAREKGFTDSQDSVRPIEVGIEPATLSCREHLEPGGQALDDPPTRLELRVHGPVVAGAAAYGTTRPNEAPSATGMDLILWVERPSAAYAASGRHQD